MKAAEQHQMVAVEWVAFAYYEGDNRCGILKDTGKAVPYLKEAADFGFRSAMVFLGDIFQNGDEKAWIPIDFGKSAVYYRMAANLNDKMGQFMYAEACRLGRGVPKDYVEAYAWYNIAASHNDEWERRQS